MAEIDTNLYSRQIGTFGMEAMGKLMQMRVLISGMRGVGVETAKNLILAGPGHVTIHDTTTTTIQDLGSNFYLTEADVGNKQRGEASVEKLRELNPYVNVENYQGELTEDFLAQFNVIVLSETDGATLTRINNFCRASQPQKGFISCESWGASGYAFLDYGDEFTVFDQTGEECKQYLVSGITQENPGIVTVNDEKRHIFQDGDYVVFREVQGMVELNDSPPRPIKYVSPYSFSIEDTTGYSAYTREGIVEQVKVPSKLSFKSWDESNVNPLLEEPLNIPDLGKFGRSEQLHFAFRAVREFQKNKGHLPQLHNAEDADEVLRIAQELNQAGKDSEGFSVDEVEGDVVRNVSLYARAQISPMAAFWGGIVAQEVIKFTGKYTPLRQWLHFDSFEIITEDADKAPKNTRYDDQVAIIGQQVQDKLQNAKTFMVGAGALGCEFLKGFAMLGLACGPNGECIVTDDDQIEVSNLNRQFLFRQNNVGKSKSETAGQVVKGMNSDFKVQANQNRVEPATENIYNDAFWESRDVIINAVDNVKARLYVDSRCVWYGKPLLESGTLGTKANSQVILPHKTQSYGDSQDPPEESIPMCTLKNFPHAIEHCIEWSRDVFEGYFSDTPREVNNFLADPSTYLQRLPSMGNVAVQKDKLEKIKDYLSLLNNPTFENCVRVARLKMQDLFHDTIAQLLYNFPVDFLTKDGQPFWSGPKRAPNAMEFNPLDEAQSGFLFSAANLYAYNLGIQELHDVDAIREIASNVDVPPFQPKKVSIQLEEGQDAPTAPVTDIETEVQTLRAELQGINQELVGKKLNPAEFEKDDDSNHHIDFIHAASNLRAANYRIPQADRNKTKLTAGKIIPAIATTTAMITGSVLIELYKLFIHDNVERFKNTFANLALPLWVLTEPMPPIRQRAKDYDPILMGPVRAYPDGFSSWDKLEIQGPVTIQQLLDKLKEDHHLVCKIISSGTTCIYNGYLPQGKHNDRLSRDLVEIYQELSKTQLVQGRRYIAVECSCEDEQDGVDMNIPVVKVNF